MATIDTPPSRVPPTSPPVVANPAPPVNVAAQNPSNPMDIRQPYDDTIPGEFAEAMAQAQAWNNSIGPMWNSAAGYGSGGFNITAPDAADDWPTGMAFPHQGP